MEKININCPAKINLSLDVIGKREDGYHLLKMIMQTVSLYDEVEIAKTSKGIKVFCNNSKVPCDETNSAYKAAKLMFDKFNIVEGIDITINKKIPVAAGLAGGSTDAAGVIKGINEMFDLKLNTEELMKIGLCVGADVPYCILGGTALAEGVGEVLTPLKAFNDIWCVIAKPDVSVSTFEVYKKLKIDEIVKHCDTEKMVKHIEEGDISKLSKGMVNVLENVTIKDHPIIEEIKGIMIHYDAHGSLMSGSGPSVFGLFKTEEDAKTCRNRLSDFLKEVYLVKTCSK